MKVKIFFLTLLSLTLLVPVHELGHYLGANIVGVEVDNFSLLPTMVDGKFINPYVMVDEYSFPTTISLMRFYLMGCMFTMLFGGFLTLAAISMKWTWWRYPYMWVIAGPLVSLNDFDRVMELLLVAPYYSRWVHVALGVLTTIMIYSVRRKKNGN